MQLFYLEHPENEIILSAEESKHATKVLRKKEGDILNFTDGKGGFYKAEITVAMKSIKNPQNIRKCIIPGYTCFLRIKFLSVATPNLNSRTNL